MTKEECARVLAVKYELDYNTFKMNEKLKADLARIRREYFDDDEFNRLFLKAVDELRHSTEKPRWARLLYAENYAINI